MGYSVRLTPMAGQDLDAIVSYITASLKNPTAATAFLDEVSVTYTYLEENPLMFEKCRDERLSLLEYRRVVIKKYVMIYRVDEQENAVYILRFFYGMRDYESLI